MWLADDNVIFCSHCLQLTEKLLKPATVRAYASDSKPFKTYSKYKIFTQYVKTQMQCFRNTAQNCIYSPFTTSATNSEQH